MSSGCLPGIKKSTALLMELWSLYNLVFLLQAGTYNISFLHRDVGMCSDICQCPYKIGRCEVPRI